MKKITFLSTRDNIPQTLEKLDEYLLTFTKWRCGLYEFAYVVACEIRESNPRYMAAPEDLPKLLRRGHRGKRKYFRETIRELERTKKQIIKSLGKDFQYHGMFPEGRIRERDIEYIKNVYPEVDTLFKKIEEKQHDYRERLTYGLPWIKKGHLTDAKHKIAFVFAQVIKRENGQVNWTVIKSLLIWFWKRFKGTPYRDELADSNDPVYITEKTLGNAYSKAIKNPEKKSSIEQSARRYFSVLSRGSRYGTRIEFGENYITANEIVAGDIGSHYPTIVFPDGKVLKDMLNLEEAAAFLNVPSLFLERLCKKELIPFRQPEDDEQMIFSRRELMEWKRQTFGDRPIFKKKFLQKYRNQRERMTGN